MTARKPPLEPIAVRFADHIKALVDDAPPFSVETATRLAELIRPALPGHQREEIPARVTTRQVLKAAA